MTATATRTTGALHRRVHNPATGHDLRLTRWHDGATERTVYRVMPGNALIELGTVTVISVTGQPPVTIAWGTIDAHLREGITVSSYLEGARALDDRIEVTPVTTYRLSARKAMPVSTGHATIDADQTDVQGDTDGR